MKKSLFSITDFWLCSEVKENLEFTAKLMKREEIKVACYLLAALRWSSSLVLIFILYSINQLNIVLTNLSLCLSSVLHHSN